MKRLLSAFLVLLIVGRSMADEAKPGDFSEGFNKLAALGLPPLPEGTKWSVLPESMTGDRSDDALSKSVKGGGWLFPPPESGKRQVLLMGEIAPTDFEPEGEQSGESPGLLGKIFGGGKKKPVADTGADLAKDVKSLRTNLGKATPDSSDPFAERGSYQAQGVGKLLLFATQIYQSGEPALANELAAGIFEAVPNRETVIDGAIDQLGNHFYEKETTSFFQTKDWKAYHQEVRALVAKFPRGWANRDAAAILMELLSSRAAGNPPAIPKLEGIPLDPKALASVAWMPENPPAADTKSDEMKARLAEIPAQYRAQYLRQMAMDGGNSLGHPGTWLLKKADDFKDGAGVTTPTLKLGIAALPVLAALVEDNYLTPHANPGASRHSYFSSSESAAERVAKAYASLNRPATRGDIACYLLRATLPDPQGELSSADPATLRELARDFWTQHKNDSLEGVALAFLREGSSEQKAEAAQLLAASTNPADQKSLEAHILAEPSPASQLVTVKTYVQVRKAAAKPFLDLYVKALREELGDGNLSDNRDLPWEIRSMKSIEPMIKQLESQVSGKSPQARAREIAKEDPKTARAAIPAFLHGLYDTKPKGRVLAMLAGANAAENPEIRALFINAIFQSQRRMRGEIQEGDQSKPAELSPAEIKIWETLLADQRGIPVSVSRGSTGYGKSLGELAAVALEYTAAPGAFEGIQEAATITGKSVVQISVVRAASRIAGQPIPALPDASKIPPTRLAEIVAGAGAKAPLEIHPYLKTLTDDERAAWLKWHAEPGDLAIPENVRKLDFMVLTRLPEYWHYRDMPGTLNVDVGFELNKESIEKLVQHLAADIPRHSRSSVMIQSAPFPPGLQVLATKLDLPAKKPKTTTEENTGESSEDDEDEEDFSSIAYRQLLGESINDFQSEETPQNATAVIHANWYNTSGRAEGTWPVIDGKAALKNPEFLATIAAKTAAEGDFSFTLQVLSRADAEALKESE